MAGKVIVAGTGMTPFATPRNSAPYTELAVAAGQEALDDAGIDYADIQAVYVGYVFGDSTSGQRAVYGLGLSGVPIVNVNNNCATGSTALYLARQAIASGSADCVLALGFEQMSPGALGLLFEDRPTPLDPFLEVADRQPGISDGPLAPRLFGSAGQEHIDRYGTRPETFAMLSVKARAHAAHNDKAVFRTPVTVEEVLASPQVYGPLTRLQCCPPTCGAGAAVLMSPEFARRKGVTRGVELVAQALTTDTTDSFEGSMIAAIGGGMSRAAADQVYRAAGIGPEDVDVVELHDCFTTNELLSYEALGLVEPGGAERFIVDGDNSYGGRIVVNPSGGLLSKGHPLGATGLAQCHELVSQLRGTAGVRQVPNARVALQHNIGLGGACVVTLYRSN